jgi:hypothetical protein
MQAIGAPGAFNEQQTDLPDTNELDEMVNLARVSGQVKAATVRQIGDLIEKILMIRSRLFVTGCIKNQQRAIHEYRRRCPCR